jgi:hypothetical protein
MNRRTTPNFYILAGKQKPKLKREAQYPLPNGLMGQHIINQQGGAFCHSPHLSIIVDPKIITFFLN